ncbi:MAG: hypothetical protein KA140_00010 [Caldisericia bacterium]|nr:hypothetical protein [Caldisericia bacterium]
MGKTLGVSLLIVALLAGCSKTTDNHNISITFYKNGEQQIVEVEPGDQLIDESVENKETVYKDKLERWQQTKKNKIILEKDDGSYLYQDGQTGNYFWKTKDRGGNDVIENLYDMQNRVGSRFWYEANKTKISG